VLVMSRRPGRIRADFEVPLPRPRSAEQLTSADFNRQKKFCLDLLREEAHLDAAGNEDAVSLPSLELSVPAAEHGG
jgi:NitT/TauT family transport system ATP-binding protein